MDQLRKLLDRFGRRRNARYWLGPRPEARTKALPRAIARMAGYPTSEGRWTDRHDLQPVDLEQAAKVLAFAATESLAYGRRSQPRESYRKLAAAALGAFDAEPAFLTNIGWDSDGEMRWSAGLTTATFEAGLIAYDSRNALIFWIEEED